MWEKELGESGRAGLREKVGSRQGGRGGGSDGWWQRRERTAAMLSGGGGLPLCSLLLLHLFLLSSVLTVSF